MSYSSSAAELRVKRTVLLSILSVRSEGIWEGVALGGRVSMRAMVDFYGS